MPTGNNERALLVIAVANTFRRHFRVSGNIGAVIVDGVLLPHPFQVPPLSSVQVSELFLIPPPPPLRSAGRLRGRSLAGIHMELLVGGEEGRLAPIGFLQTPSGGPVICIPQARIQLHRLVEWVPHPQILAVLEHSNWYRVNKKTRSGTCSRPLRRNGNPWWDRTRDICDALSHPCLQ